MTKWVPFTLPWDDHLPVDISFVFEHEKPAGKHGFLTVKGDHFAFEDGTEGRFWGTNFNSGANFPPHEYSEMVARRLAKFGVNIMRTHQMDSEWATPNIFTRNRAMPKDHTRSFDPDCMDKLDYLFSCLKKEGVYVYLDLLTYRQFLPGDAVDAYAGLPQAAKPYLYFDRRLIELQKEFNENLWSHLNPYTGLAFKDDPLIAMSELVNEADPFSNAITLEPYRTRLEVHFRQWLEEKHLSQPNGAVDFTQREPAIGQFFVQVMMDYNAEMIAHLRKIGVRIPIAGTNHTTYLGVTAAQSTTDFTDSHVYWNYPWSDSGGTVTRKPMVASDRNDFATLNMMRKLDKPFFVGEWDHAYPAEYRAESSLALAAVSAFQGWGGATIHTYRYSTWTPENRLAGGSSTINGIVYRNFFDAYNDPAKFGLFYHAALMLRRGDIQQSKEPVALQVADQPGWENKGPKDLDGLSVIAEQHKVGMSLPGESPVTGSVKPAEKASVDGRSGEVLSDTGELWRSWKKRIAKIDSPRSKAAYGFLGEAGTVELDGLKLEVSTDYAVIALSSLSDENIADSGTMLLTAVGRCENSGVVMSEDGNHMLDAGHHPMLIEPIAAKIQMQTSRPHLKVFVISEHGELVCRLPVQIEDGWLKFEIGAQRDWYPSTMYYLIRT